MFVCGADCHSCMYTIYGLSLIRSPPDPVEIADIHYMFPKARGTKKPTQVLTSLIHAVKTPENGGAQSMACHQSPYFIEQTPSRATAISYRQGAVQDMLTGTADNRGVVPAAVAPAPAPTPAPAPPGPIDEHRERTAAFFAKRYNKKPAARKAPGASPTRTSPRNHKRSKKGPIDLTQDD